jgi:hypothetical protein
MRKKLSVANKELHQKVHEAQMHVEKYCTDFKKVQSRMRKAEYQLKQ